MPTQAQKEAFLRLLNEEHKLPCGLTRGEIANAAKQWGISRSAARNRLLRGNFSIEVAITRERQRDAALAHAANVKFRRAFTDAAAAIDARKAEIAARLAAEQNDADE